MTKEELNLEAEGRAKDYTENKERQIAYECGFLDGADLGYNKANEWHKIANNDLPESDNRIVLCVCGNGFIDGKKNHTLKLLTRKEFSLFQPVYYWKEIVLPELPKEN